MTITILRKAIKSNVVIYHEIPLHFSISARVIMLIVDSSRISLWTPSEITTNISVDRDRQRNRENAAVTGCNIMTSSQNQHGGRLLI